ncbi:hypothetical protein [Psychrilyobacter atlanticus]|uniref:hypothetical protein n=1 Tax=Psychrilyobacter atlanticus TaxID=271091 RepID=UPI0004018192|nr:hypothetical protein [Psychrilyobacter atlanticus]
MKFLWGTTIKKLSYFPPKVPSKPFPYNCIENMTKALYQRLQTLDIIGVERRRG